MIIPYYRENGFQLDFERTAPVDYDNLAMYIHPRIKLIFRDIWSPESSTQFSIGYMMENGEDFDCDDFTSRMEEFVEFEKARTARVFNGRRKSIFFDEEEVALLANTFGKEKFTAVIEVSIDDKMIPIDKIPDDLYKTVRPFLLNYSASEMLDADEYRRFKKVKKAVLKRRTTMNKKKSIINLVLGSVAAGIGVVVVSCSSIIIKESIQDIRGKIVEVDITE